MFLSVNTGTSFTPVILIARSWSSSSLCPVLSAGEEFGFAAATVLVGFVPEKDSERVFTAPVGFCPFLFIVLSEFENSI